jgi:hypothetical protein
MKTEITKEQTNRVVEVNFSDNHVSGKISIVNRWPSIVQIDHEGRGLSIHIEGRTIMSLYRLIDKLVKDGDVSIKAVCDGTIGA